MIMSDVKFNRKSNKRWLPPQMEVWATSRRLPPPCRSLEVCLSKARWWSRRTRSRGPHQAPRPSCMTFSSQTVPPTSCWTSQKVSTRRAPACSYTPGELIQLEHLNNPKKNHSLKLKLLFVFLSCCSLHSWIFFRRIEAVAETVRGFPCQSWIFLQLRHLIKEFIKEKNELIKKYLAVPPLWGKVLQQKSKSDLVSVLCVSRCSRFCTRC